MSDLNQLLDTDPIVATAGTDMLADSIEQQGSTVSRADWRPPHAGTEEALARLATDGRMAEANNTAVKKLLGMDTTEDEKQLATQVEIQNELKNIIDSADPNTLQQLKELLSKKSDS